MQIYNKFLIIQNKKYSIVKNNLKSAWKSEVNRLSLWCKNKIYYGKQEK